MRIPRHWRITVPHAIVAAWVLLILLAAHANAQPIRYDQTATTTSPQCASGKQCPLNVLPGTIVSFCTTTGFSTLAACLANPLTTYTNVGGGTPCPTTAQLTPATGGACLSTADNQGSFGIWFQPQTAYYYLRVPATAGGGTYGPYPFSFGVDGQASGVSYQLPATGSIPTTVATKLNSFYEAVADFGADPTGATDSTAASQAAITAALALRPATGTCAHFIAGKYKLTYSSVASLVLPSNACLKGDGPNQTIFLEQTPGATIMAVTGHNVYLRDFFLAMGSGITATAATGLSLYPDVTSTTQVQYGVFDNVSIASQWCNEDPTNACQAAANANRLRYGVLLQSGAKDNIFNRFTNLYVRFATEGVYMLSGGLAGSANTGAVNANTFISPDIADVTDCAKFGGSGENHFLAMQCTDASHAEVTLTSNPFGGAYGSSASSKNYIQTFGESNAALADFTVAGTNTVATQSDESDGGTTGDIIVLGAQQANNTVTAQGVFQTGFYDLGGAGNSVDPFVSGPYVDNHNAPPTATLDFRSTKNNPLVMRIRNWAHANTGNDQYDYYRLNPTSFGHIFRNDVGVASLAVPVASFQNMYVTGTQTSVFTRYLSDTTANTVGDIMFAYNNTASNGSSSFKPGVMNNSSVEQFPFSVSGGAGSASVVAVAAGSTFNYQASGYSAGNVLCFKAGGTVGYAVVTAGAVGSCN